jgi:hypothetical protein
VKLLAKAHRKVGRPRSACAHNAALALARQDDMLEHEEWPVANLLGNHHQESSSGIIIRNHHQESSSGEVHPGRRMECLPEHPFPQGSMRRSEGDGGASCVYQSDLFGLWRHRHDSLVGPLACLPGLWSKPAS